MADINHPLTHPVGRPSRTPNVLNWSFYDQLRTKPHPRRGVADSEWHEDDLPLGSGPIAVNLLVEEGGPARQVCHVPDSRGCPAWPVVRRDPRVDSVGQRTAATGSSGMAAAIERESRRPAFGSVGRCCQQVRQELSLHGRIDQDWHDVPSGRLGSSISYAVVT